MSVGIVHPKGNERSSELSLGKKATPAWYVQPDATTKDARNTDIEGLAEPERTEGLLSEGHFGW